MAGGSMAKGSRLAASFLLRSVSIALFPPPLSLSVSFFHLCSGMFLPSFFKYLSSSTMYSYPCFSRTVFSSLFDIGLQLSKDKFDALSCVCARARISPSLPSGLLVVFSLSPSLSPFAADFAHSQGWPTMT